MIKSRRGITLIALVVTIIVLLLLAGVSISMLTGQNGILNRAGEAKEKTDIAQKEELAKLEGLEAVTNVSGYVDSKTGVKIPAGYMVSKVEGENSLEDGLVIKDADGNEFVWVEVPKNIYTNTTYNTQTSSGDKQPSSATDYDNIEFCLRKYAAPYTKGSATQNYDGKDEWYDYCGTTYNGVDNYSLLTRISNVANDPGSFFSKAKTYYGKIYEDTALTVEVDRFTSGKTYYVKITDKINDTTGCGMTYEEYNQTKKKMLTSVYSNGGFWISRYEIGCNKLIEFGYGDEKGSTKPVSKVNQIPYLYASCSIAESLAKELAQNSMTTSSVPFGVQWALVCKYLEVKSDLTQDDINKDSKGWGNNCNSEITLNRGKYAKWQNGSLYGDKWYEYKETVQYWVENGQKQGYSNSKGIFLTTGASDQAKKMNIYDFAGNVWEWTLEHVLGPENVYYAIRGGDYCNYGNKTPASSVYYSISNSEISSFYNYRCAYRTLLIAIKVLADII